MIYSRDIARELAEYLLQIKAIKLQPHNPFTWSSGWRSPIYCDNRSTLSHPEIRSFIKENLAAIVKDKFSEANLVVSVATAGIPHGALLADHLKLPYAYVRPKPKEHGLAKQIEGNVNAGQKAVIVEDLISTGISSLKVLPPLSDAGCKIEGVVAIFTYGFPLAQKNFDEACCEYYTLSDYDHLLEVTSEQGIIQPNDLELLNEWKRDPEAWGKITS